MSDCVMRYRAGTQGLVGLGIPDSDPHWYCSCGNWRFAARHNARSVTGNNLAAAERAFAKHSTAQR